MLGHDAELIPLVSFEIIKDTLATGCLLEWGHWLGPCRRPFGQQSFGLFVRGEQVAVAVSASTVNARCAGFRRDEVVELARLCADPGHPWATRVALRLWREMAPRVWPYWRVLACVSYSNALRHTGNVYRFDGWEKAVEVRGSKAKTPSPNPGRPRRDKDPKAVWVWRVPA